MSSQVYRLTTPISTEDSSRLRIGDVVYLSGRVFTMRDRAHEELFARADRTLSIEPNLENSAIWHCGPVSRKGADGRWEISSIGPTTSFRLTRETPRLLSEFGVKLLIGKGGMGYEAVQAMRQHGAAFLSATGGCGSIYAQQVDQVKNLFWEELGLPEAVWELNVIELGALIVTIDSTGASLYDLTMQQVRSRISACYDELGIGNPDYRFIHWPPTLAGTKEVPESLAKVGGGE